MQDETKAAEVIRSNNGMLSEWMATNSERNKGEDYTVISNGLSNVALQEPQTSVGPWNDWENLPVGHNRATAAMTALRTHTDDFLQDLINVRKEWEGAKSKSQQIYESVTSSAIKQCEDEKRAYTNECEKMCRTQNQEAL